MKVEAVVCSTSLPSHQTIDNSTNMLGKLYGMLSPKKPKKPTLLRIPSAARRAPPPLSSDDRHGEFARVFRHLDEDGDGKISPSELRNCMMRSVGEELSPEDAEAVVSSADSDGDGLLGLDDFMRLAEAEEEEEKGKSLWAAFGVYREGEEECITPRSLRTALARLGQPKSMEECMAMIRRFDINGDGVICFEEFKIMML